MADRREVFLERMTWPEIEDAVTAGQTRAVVCLAATEQHGPHLPEGTDAWLGEELAGRLARALGDALVAPIIRTGCSEHHMGFAGTITVPVDALVMLLDSYVDSLSRHGFDRFLVFTSHGGNLPVLANWPGRSRQQVTVLDDLTAVTEAIQRAVSRFGTVTPAGRHADLGETAAMLAIQPELVRLGLARPGFQGEIGLDELLRAGVRGLSPSGTFGDPRGATATMGAAVLAAWTDCLLDNLRATRPSPAAPDGRAGSSPPEPRSRPEPQAGGQQALGWHSAPAQPLPAEVFADADTEALSGAALGAGLGATLQP